MTGPRVASVRLVVAATAVCLVVAACGGGGAATSATGSLSPTTSTPASSTSTASPTASASTTATAARTATASRTPSRTRTATAEPTELAPVPRAGAEPTVRFPDNPAAVGSGANARISAVPDSLWQKMIGYSWTSGCPVGRSSLRYVSVNFWGFDGKRSRGAVVVHSSIASRTARGFTALYDQQFRIRQMRPMDSSWGHNPKGPGADDYAAMEADNTSAFNCRYVGGQEDRKVYSNHAYGKAIDVNDFENPYVADDGKVYPNSYFLHRRSPAPGVFSSSRSAAVRAFTSQGLRWGGQWSHPDYQHFDLS